jgi:hypothetical protein
MPIFSRGAPARFAPVLGLAVLFACTGVAAAQPAGERPFPYADAARCRDRSYFDVVNRSATPVLEIYIRRSGQTGNWGKDRLGDGVLAVGGRQRFDPGVGVFDVLLIRADGQAFLTMRQRSCTINAVELGQDDRVSVR